MTAKPWFTRRRSFGWGWRPITWQGWVIALLIVAVAVFIGFHFGLH